MKWLEFSIHSNGWYTHINIWLFDKGKRFSFKNSRLERPRLKYSVGECEHPSCYDKFIKSRTSLQKKLKIGKCKCLL